MRCCHAPRKARGKRSRATMPPPIPPSASWSCVSSSANSGPLPCSSSTACSPNKSKPSCKHSWRLVAQYQRDDVQQALERAVRFGAFSLGAIRRILAAWAWPKALLFELAELHREALDPSLRRESIGPRPTSDYQHLLLPEEDM